MVSKVFTLEEANTLIPTLELRLPKLLQTKRALSDYVSSLVKKGINVESLFGMTDLVDDDLVAAKAELEKLGNNLQGELAAIQELGCVVKDMELGLVDFLGQVGLDQVYFCWQLGEPTIRYWHGLQEGFADRKALFEEDENDKGHQFYH